MHSKLIVFAVAVLCELIFESRAVASPIVCKSPGGTLAIELSLEKGATTDQVPHYRVRAGADVVIGWSPLGIDLKGGELLGGPCEITELETRSIHDKYVQFPGKRRHVVGHATEATVRLRETTKPCRRWEVILRAYDDGVAFRYRFPAQEGWTQLAIAEERTRFALPAGSRAIAYPLNSFTTSFEKRYETRPVAALPADWLLGLPLLVERPGGGWAAITEADLDEYAGMYLAPAGATTLKARLSPLPSDPKLAVKAALPHESPWRVVMVSQRAGRFIESDIVLNLSKPCIVNDTSWIKPGKTTFPWWNGYVLDGVDFKPGQNTATHKHYLDFCAANGIEYHSLDGLDNIAWYGGTIIPHGGGDPTKALPEIDLPELLEYANKKGVRLRFWMHWKAAQQHMTRAFPLYKQWGVEGVMLDFMDRDDQEMNRFLRSAVKLAAENQLTVTLHGVSKPTGLERTYPNLLTHESVLNLEYNKWDELGCPPEHQVMVAFTRMLAGPLDFHQGSFRGVAPEVFKPRDKAPLVMGTPCRTLASYVVYQNHLSMVADSPSAYAGHPALAALARIPASWDDTRVVAESVGEFVAIARRDRDAWHVGAMTDRKSRTLTIPLKFLGPGRYTADLWLDDLAANHGLLRKEAIVTMEGEVTVDLAPSGGAYLKFTPMK
jgi:alpha-glucosidase